MKSLDFDADIRINLISTDFDKYIMGLSDKLDSYDAIPLYYAGHGF